MNRHAAFCFLFLLLLAGSVSAAPLIPARVSASATTAPKMTRVPVHPEVVSCGEGAVNCNGKCTNINVDNTNCGSCGMTCFSPAVCCNGECVDLRYDDENCGTCGMTCFKPAWCCDGSCEENNCPYGRMAEVTSVGFKYATPPAVGLGVATTPAVGFGIATTPAAGAADTLSPVQPVVQRVSGAIVPLPGTPHTLITTSSWNITSATPVPKSCPTSEWTCMPLAQAAAKFGYPYAQYGSVPCAYITEGGQSVAEYCCRDVPGGSLSPVSLGAMGVKNADPGLHIINRTPVTAKGAGQGMVYGRIIEPRADFVSALFSFFGGFFAQPVPCGEGSVNCNGKCSNINFDEANCGTCGMTCFDPAVCCNGECVDLDFDDENCGTCGMTCFDPASCVNSSCENVAETDIVEPEVAEMATVEPVALDIVTPSS